MDGEYIGRAEYQEFTRRMEDENRRQNERLDTLDAVVKEIHSLTIEVSNLAHGIESMTAELGEHGERLKAIEGRDGEMWRKVVEHIALAFAAAVAGYVISRLGF